MAKDRVPEIFADGIGRYSFSGGVVRLDLISVDQVSKEEQRAASTTVTQRLILSPEGFLRTMSTLNKLLKQLVDAGVVTQRPASAPESAISGEGEES